MATHAMAKSPDVTSSVSLFSDLTIELPSVIALPPVVRLPFTGQVGVIFTECPVIYVRGEQTLSPESFLIIILRYKSAH